MPAAAGDHARLIAPIADLGDVPGGFDRYGFRVPLIVVSPWARARYVSSVVQDHTSITAFVERKWNLPAMTFRDANADADDRLLRLPQARVPEAAAKLAAAPSLGPGLAACHAAGLNPAADRLSYRRLRATAAPRAVGYSAVPPARPGRGSGRGPSRRSPAGVPGIGTSGGGGASAPNTSSSVPPAEQRLELLLLDRLALDQDLGELLERRRDAS